MPKQSFALGRTERTREERERKRQGTTARSASCCYENNTWSPILGRSLSSSHLFYHWYGPVSHRMIWQKVFWEGSRVRKRPYVETGAKEISSLASCFTQGPWRPVFIFLRTIPPPSLPPPQLGPTSQGYNCLSTPTQGLTQAHRPSQGP